MGGKNDRSKLQSAIERAREKRSKSLRKLAYDSMYRPGIDLAVVIALGSAIVDLVSLFFPWLVGINSDYLPGRGLIYKIAVLLSAIDLFSESPYLMFLMLPIALTIALIFLSIKPEGIIPPRIGYKTKSRIILFLAGLSSMLPAYIFLNGFTMGIYSPPQLGVFVGRWELGGAATMPLYAGFGFMLALGLKMIKD